MSVFEFSDYVLFLKAWITLRPKNGRGEVRRMADALGIQSSMISQVLSGQKVLSAEHAVELSEHIGLSEKESDYLISLVEYARAGSVKLKNRIKKRIEQGQKQAARISQRIHSDLELDDKTKAIYYSNWMYGAVRNMTAIEGLQQVDTLVNRLQLAKPIVIKVVDFLLEHGLCRLENGRLTYGPAWIFLSRESPLITRHHQNWRLRGFTKMEDPSESNLFFTSPMSLSEDVAKEIRMRLPAIIEEIQKAIKPSKSETVRCLNIDWYEY